MDYFYKIIIKFMLVYSCEIIFYLPKGQIEVLMTI